MSTLLKFELAPHTLQFSVRGSVYPSARPGRVTQVFDRTAGGEPKVANLGVNIEGRVLIFRMLPRIDYLALRNWYFNVAKGAANPFDFTDEYGEVFENVRIINTLDDFKESFMCLFDGTLVIEYAQ